MYSIRESFGEYIKRLREEKNLPLRKVAAKLDIDPSTLSKIERGQRSPHREMILIYSKIFKIDEDSLNLIYLSDKIANDLVKETNSSEVLKMAEKKIEYLKTKQIEQRTFDF
jgi:transcriptional regulator with XRE-family HTH domain